MEFAYIFFILMISISIIWIYSSIKKKLSSNTEDNFFKKESTSIKYECRKNGSVVELWEKSTTDTDFIHTGGVETSTNTILPLEKKAKSTTLIRLLDISRALSKGTFPDKYNNVINVPDVEQIVKDAKKTLDDFYGLVLSSPQGLSEKLDNKFISNFMHYFENKLQSPEYKSSCKKLIEKYGSVRMQVYDLLGGTLANAYATNKDFTQLEKHTLDYMLYIVNSELKKLNAKTFFTKNAPMGTPIYPE